MNLKELIEVFVEYKGKQREMYIDCGKPFLEACQKYKNLLQKCSFFEEYAVANKLIVNFEDGKYVIYFTDERASIWGVQREFNDIKTVVDTILKLLGSEKN